MFVSLLPSLRSSLFIASYVQLLIAFATNTERISMLPHVHCHTLLNINPTGMKDGLVEKLTLIIETTNGHDIAKEVMSSISSLQRTVASHKDIKLSLSFKEALPSIDKYSPPGWDYWPM